MTNVSIRRLMPPDTLKGLAGDTVLIRRPPFTAADPPAPVFDPLTRAVG